MAVGSLLPDTFHGLRSSVYARPELQQLLSFLRACFPESIFRYKRNAGCRFLRFVIRHCSRCAAKTELCVTLISFEALVSFDSKVLTAYLSSRETSELAVDLINRHRSADEFLLRKEVIQPQVPLRLPCYDFIPVTTHSVGGCLYC